MEQNKQGSRESRWSRGVYKQSWWRSDVDAWLFVSSENDYILNRSGKWLQKQYQKHRPIGLHRLSYKPIVNDQTSDWKQANNQEPLTDRATKVEQSIPERSNCNKASNSSKSSRITINWPDNWPNNWTNTSTSTSTSLEVGVGQRSGSGARGLEPARGQEPTVEALKI